MPGRGRYTKRKTFKRRASKRAGVYSSAGYQLWKDVKWLKSVVNVEKKHLEFNSSTTSSTTPAFILLNACALGDTGEQRNGQSIKMTSLLLRFTFIQNVAATTGSVNRLMVFLDRQANAAAPSASDLLDTSTAVLSPLNISNGSRFKVLMDEFINTDLVANPIVTVEKYLSMQDHAKYNAGNAGTIADITTNSLYVMHMSSEATNVSTFNYYFRTRFIDN